MPIDPHDIDIDSLPRAVVGGLRPEPVAELFRRLTWDYSQLQVEYRKLQEATGGRAEVTAGEPQPKQVEEASDDGKGPAPAGRRSPPAGAAPRAAAHPDELVRFALAAANRIARELRESARADCEAMLRKVHARTAKLERELAHLETLREARLSELDATLGELGDEIRSALQVILEAAPEVAPRLSAVATPPPETAPASESESGDRELAEDAPPAPVPLLRRQK